MGAFSYSYDSTLPKRAYAQTNIIELLVIMILTKHNEEKCVYSEVVMAYYNIIIYMSVVFYLVALYNNTNIIRI
jgi:hypothetical protein